jgi:DNA-binding NtrC family response regulator
MSPRTIIVTPPSPTVRAALADRGFAVVEVLDEVTLRSTLRACTPALVIVGSVGSSGIPLAREIRRHDRDLPIVLLVDEGSEEIAIEAVRAGVTDYVKHPVTPDGLIASLGRCPSRAMTQRLGGPALVGVSEALRRVREYVARVAATESSVLITGETGTGKEVVATLIHEHSGRRTRPFVTINCAALPDTLLESELFGYERGAFTGASAARVGRLQAAHGGTLFLDEIGDMSLYAQAKLLRVIEQREIQPLGTSRVRSIDVRIVAATNHELEQRVADNAFRRDLYYRLNVASIQLPPLRSHAEDVPHLLAHYVAENNHRFRRAVEGFTGEALEHLVRYDWPGNVREIKNLVEAVFVQGAPAWIGSADLPERYRERMTSSGPVDERARVVAALFATRWNKSAAAERLRWSRMTLYRKMAKYGIGVGEDQAPRAGNGGSPGAGWHAVSSQVGPRRAGPESARA